MARWALDWHFCNWWFEHVSTPKHFWAPRLSGAGSFDAIRLRACTEGQGTREQLESQVHWLGANIEAICEGAMACHFGHVTLLVIIHGICCFSKAGTQLRFSPPSPLTHEVYHFHSLWCAPALKLTLRQFAIVGRLPNEPLDHIGPFMLRYFRRCVSLQWSLDQEVEHRNLLEWLELLGSCFWHAKNNSFGPISTGRPATAGS